MKASDSASRERSRILIIEDEAQIRKFLRISLGAHGFTILEARLGEDGLSRCAADDPDLVILDLGLPDMDGLDVIRSIRDWSRVPIIVLSVRSDESEKVVALDNGANDYVTKPFGISELMARIRVLLRSDLKPGHDETTFKAGGLEVDFVNRAVTVSGEEIQLSKKEYALLRLFVTHPGRLLTHQQILRDVWGPSHVSDIHYLRVLVGHLRQRIGDDPARPSYIQTVQGVGYRFLAMD